MRERPYADKVRFPKTINLERGWTLQLLAEIGRGASSGVYLASYQNPTASCPEEGADGTETGQLAVKAPLCLFEDDDRSPDSFQDLIREGKLLSTLKSPHIVQGTLRFTDEQIPLVVMERVGFRDLRWLMEEKRQLPPLTAIRLARELLEALAFLEEDGRVLAHRDIKPANLLIDEEGALRLADFGIARMAETASKEDYAFAGSILYSAPEQIEDPAQADIRSDIYSVGLVFREMIAGHAWQAELSPSAIRETRCRQHATPPPLVASSLTAEQQAEMDMIIQKACAPEPLKRFQSPQEFVEALGMLEEHLAQHQRKRALLTPLLMLAASVILVLIIGVTADPTVSVSPAQPLFPL